MKILAHNFVFQRFPTAIDFSELAELLPHATLKPVGALEYCSSGFVSPFGDDRLLVNIATSGFDALWVSVGTETKILPGSVLSRELGAKIKQVEERDGRMPGGRERKRMKDDLLHELLPKAFVKAGRADALIFPALGLIAVATSSRKVAEHVVSQIRSALGSFPAMPLNAEVAPRSVLTGWIAGETLPDGLSLGFEATLADPVQGGAVVKLKDQELLTDEVEKHLEAGKQCTRLALVNGERASFTVGDDLVLRKFKIGEVPMNEQNADDNATIAEFQTATMTIIAAELLVAFEIMASAFRISKAD